MPVSNLGQVVGNSFTILESSGPVTGVFAGLANNATFTAGGMTLRVNYFATKVRLTRVS